jgi:crotonobetainyl-CoA:carnitine CoA-transferase CaiB-like acyl-CoA transferase
VAQGVSAAEGPLAGIRVIDLCHFLAGPYASVALADLGADVVKVEDPDRPDEARSIGPHFQQHQSLYFSSLNWGKRSIALRLAHPDGLPILKRLIQSADVVIDNFRPGVMPKLQLDHASLETLNDRLITCSLTGFGETGPYAKRPGYDYTIQAISGVMSLTGEPDTPPGKAGISYVDHSSGLAACFAICAALVERTRTNRGRHIDLGLFDVQMSMLTYLASWELNGGHSTGRTSQGSHPSLVPAQTFATQDGYISVFVGNESMWNRLVEAIGDQNLADVRFKGNANRVKHRDLLISKLNAHFSGATSGHWVDLLASHNVSCGRVNEIAAALEDDQVVARGLIQTVDSPSQDSFRHLSGPIPTMSTGGLRAAPSLGQDATELLTELGYSTVQITELIKSGAIVVEK